LFHHNNIVSNLLTEVLLLLITLGKDTNSFPHYQIFSGKKLFSLQVGTDAQNLTCDNFQNCHIRVLKIFPRLGEIKFSGEETTA